MWMIGIKKLPMALTRGRIEGFVPLWLWFLVAPSISSCQQGPLGAREIFLIPQGYTGRVVVFYEQPQGQPDQLIDGAHVYRVSESGIVRTQAVPTYEWTQLPLFYSDSAGVLKVIPSRMDWSLYSIDSLNASLPSSGSFESDFNNSRIRFSEFYIGIKGQIEEAMEHDQNVSIQSIYNKL